MKQLILIKILILTLCISCSNEEVLINNSDSLNDSYLIQRESNRLEILSLKNSILTFDESIELGMNIGKIELIKKFRGEYYLLNKELGKIFVLKNINSPIVTEITMNEEVVAVEDICFPNATDCYIIDNNSASVRIIDLTTNQLTNIEIKLPGIGSSIAGAGNQIYVTIPTKNLVAVIDTRTNLIIEQISVAGNPSIVDISYDGRFAIVIATGDGKEPPYNKPPTAARIITINLDTRKIARDNILTGKEEIGTKLIPNAMVVFDRYIYISAVNIDGGAGGYRVSSSNYATTSVVVRNSCTDVIKGLYSVLFIEDKGQQLNCLLLNPNNSKMSSEMAIDTFYSGCEK